MVAKIDLLSLVKKKKNNSFFKNLTNQGFLIKGERLRRKAEETRREEIKEEETS